MPQEQLLQRRRPAGEGHHPRGGQPGQHVVQGGGIHLAVQVRAADLGRVHPRQAVQDDRPGQLGVDRGPGQVPHLGQRAGLGGPAVADDRHPVGERLRLGQDVAGQQHGAAALALVVDALAEDRLHQRVEAGRRLVQDQQLGVAGQGRDQRHLLPVALGVGPRLLRRVQREPLDQVLPALGVQAGARAAQAAEQVDDLAAGQARPQGHVPGHVGEPWRAAWWRPATGRRRAGWPRRRPCAAGRAGCGWWWSCPPRSGRGRRAPRRT